MNRAVNVDDVPHPARSAYFTAHRSAVPMLEHASSEVRAASSPRDAYFRRKAADRFAARDAAMRAQLEALREPPVVVR